VCKVGQCVIIWRGLVELGQDTPTRLMLTICKIVTICMPLLQMVFLVVFYRLLPRINQIIRPATYVCPRKQDNALAQHETLIRICLYHCQHLAVCRWQSKMDDRHMTQDTISGMAVMSKAVRTLMLATNEVLVRGLSVCAPCVYKRTTYLGIRNPAYACWIFKYYNKHHKGNGWTLAPTQWFVRQSNCNTITTTLVNL
jgi:hypothetical protein